jgi:hypothetical protein
VFDGGSAALVLDVCLNYSSITGDYFVVDRAREGAQALETTIAGFMDAVGASAQPRLAPFVCGALHDRENVPKPVAESIDGELSHRPQPLWTSPALADDPAYAAALHTLATHIAEAGLRAAADEAPPKAPDAPRPAPSASPEVVRRAADLVSQRTGRTHLLYLGVTGHSLSPAKAGAIGVLQVLASVAFTVAVGPVFTAGPYSYYAVFVPGGPVDKRQMIGGLFDLKRAELVRSRVAGGRGDPMKPEVLASREGVGVILRDLVLTTVRE